MKFLTKLFYVLFQTLDPTLVTWGIYCFVIGVAFTLVKLTNFKLHHVFNTGEVVEEDGKSENAESEDAVAKTSENRFSIFSQLLFHIYHLIFF